MSFPPVPRLTVALLLLANLLLGLGQVAMMPPFEGFDEHGHYSYVQQVAATGRWPWQHDAMSRDVDDYLKVAPTADALPREWSYYPFFASSADVIARARELIQSPRPQRRAFTPGAIENWIAQHPPLFYYFAAPIALATRSLSLAGELFALRAFSYFLAWAGLCIVAIAALRGAIPARAATPTALATAAWPLLFPMWFPEMGRVGNDSLIVVWAACLSVLAWRVTASGSMRDHALAGVVLGLALLTKAIFLPVAAAFFLLLVWQAFGLRDQPDALIRRIRGICIAGLVMLAISSWWYLYKLVFTGSLIGASDVIRMHAHGGMLAGLRQNLTAGQLIGMPWDFTISFLWTGSWSFVRPPRIFMLPLIATIALMLFGLARALRRRGVAPADGFALLTVGLFFAGVIYHSFVSLSTASGPAPTYYLHALAPIVAPLVGYGMFDVMRSTRLRGLFALLMLYPLPLLLGISAISALYFAGCAPKLPGRLYFSWSSAAACIADFPRIYANLGVLALPGPGLAFFAAGAIIGIIAMIRTVRYLWTAQPVVSTA